MAGETFRFDLGNFKCLVISDGKLAPVDPPDFRIPGITAEGGESLDILSLFIDTGNHKILVDTGCGPVIEPDAGRLARNLEKEGIKTIDIDLILHTHTHLDHCTGTFDAEGRLMFPNARYILSRREWEFINAKPPEGEDPKIFAAARNWYVKIPEKIDLVEDNTEIIPGIKLLLAPGHTPGSSMFELTSGNQQLLCIGDLIHSFIEFKYPEYYIMLDVEPKKALEMRNRVFSQAAKSDTVLFVSHFPPPGLGRVVKNVELFGWKPLNTGELRSFGKV